MTELQKAHMREMVVNKRGYKAAIRAVALDVGLDEGTVQRALSRAKREDIRDEKKRKKVAS